VPAKAIHEHLTSVTDVPVWTKFGQASAAPGATSEAVIEAASEAVTEEVIEAVEDVAEDGMDRREAEIVAGVDEEEG
jgi:hypothetical protein